MGTKITFFAIFILIFVSACNDKNKDAISTQTVSLLQNKWTLISSNVIFPTNSSLNSTYKGISTDYYQFGTNDTLNIHQAGQVYLLSVPLSISIKYSLKNNNTITYGIGSTIKANIKSLTNNLLILTNSASNTNTNADGNLTVTNGTKIDSLKR
jgi:hypothetical protein